VINQVYATVDALPSLQGKTVTGGRVDAAAAVGVVVVPQGSLPHIVSAVNNVGTSAISTIRVTFDRVMNVNSFTNGDVTLTTPSGQIVAPLFVRLVNSSGGTAFDIFFPAQFAVGAYTLRVVGVADPSGNAMTPYTGTFSVISATNAPHIVSAVNNVGTSAISTIRVTFDRVMNVNSFNSGDVTLITPSGQLVPPLFVRVVNSSGGTTFDIFFPAQFAVGAYTLQITGVADPSGNLMTTYTGTFQVTASGTTAAVARIASVPDSSEVSFASPAGQVGSSPFSGVVPFPIDAPAPSVRTPEPQRTNTALTDVVFASGEQSTPVAARSSWPMGAGHAEEEAPQSFDLDAE
jgi:hypothetical protein